MKLYWENPTKNTENGSFRYFSQKIALHSNYWILNSKQDDSWGGAIELAILSSYFGLEIDVVNTQHSLINKFGEDQNYGQRILLIYDGIHYDRLYLEPFDVRGLNCIIWNVH